MDDADGNDNDGATMKLYAKIFLIFIAFLFLSCNQRYEMYGVCRHEATYAMCVAGKLYPSRMTFGDWGRPAGHNKAQAFKDGQWRWLCVDYPAVYFCPGDAGYIEKTFYTAKTWLLKYSIILKS